MDSLKGYVPNAIIDCVCKMMQKNPANRHQNVNELLEDLFRSLSKNTALRLNNPRTSIIDLFGAESEGMLDGQNELIRTNRRISLHKMLPL